MYPNEARLKNLTYKTCVFCNIGIRYTIAGQDKSIIKNFQRINIGCIPIMLHSKLCILNQTEQKEKSLFP